MNRREIQRLAAANVTAPLFKSMAAHGEDLLVERKVQLPSAERLGAEVASMANMLGGWVLLGVDDKTRKLSALELAKGLDLQSHIGHLLRNSVDPVPSFLADTLEIDGLTVGFVRVFESSVPILVSGSGAIYTRDAGGKLPISDHRVLLELASRGRQASAEAEERLNGNQLTQGELGLTRAHPVASGNLRSVVRAAPLTVNPQLADWPVTSGPGVCRETAESIANNVRVLASAADNDANADLSLRPYGRAVAANYRSTARAFFPVEATAVADCAGVFGVSVSQPVNNVVETHNLRRRFIRPLIEAVAYLLEESEAFGEVVLSLVLLPARDVDLQDEQGVFAGHRLPRLVHCGSARLTVPTDEGDREELGKRWEREVARATGIGMWEPKAISGPSNPSRGIES